MSIQMETRKGEDKLSKMEDKLKSVESDIQWLKDGVGTMKKKMEILLKSYGYNLELPTVDDKIVKKTDVAPVTLKAREELQIVNQSLKKKLEELFRSREYGGDFPASGGKIAEISDEISEHVHVMSKVGGKPEIDDQDLKNKSIESMEGATIDPITPTESDRDDEIPANGYVLVATQLNSISWQGSAMGVIVDGRSYSRICSIQVDQNEEEVVQKGAPWPSGWKKRKKWKTKSMMKEKRESDSDLDPDPDPESIPDLDPDPDPEQRDALKFIVPKLVWCFERVTTVLSPDKLGQQRSDLGQLHRMGFGHKQKVRDLFRQTILDPAIVEINEYEEDVWDEKGFVDQSGASYNITRSQWLSMPDGLSVLTSDSSTKVNNGALKESFHSGNEKRSNPMSSFWERIAHCISVPIFDHCEDKWVFELSNVEDDGLAADKLTIVIEYEKHGGKREKGGREIDGNQSSFSVEYGGSSVNGKCGVDDCPFV